jgi:hypothetical protein
MARRVAVIVVVALAALAAVATTIVSSTPPGGAAQALALVDTPSSQVVDLGSDSQLDANITTLSIRATLLAGLMTSSPLKEEIAARAGIAPASLLAVSPATSTANPGGTSVAPTTTTSPTGPTARQPNYLTANVPDLPTGQVPIIAVDTQAPTAATALRLANSSIAVLSEYLKHLAGEEHVAPSRSVVIRQLGPATSTAPPQSTSTIMTGGAALLVLAVGMGAIFGIPALRAGWRQAQALEAATDADGDGRLRENGSIQSIAPRHERVPATSPLTLRRRPSVGLEVGLDTDGQ